MTYFFRNLSRETTSPVLSPPDLPPPPDPSGSSSPSVKAARSPSSSISPSGWNCRAKFTDGSAKMLIAFSGTTRFREGRFQQGDHSVKYLHHQSCINKWQINDSRARGRREFVHVKHSFVLYVIFLSFIL